VSASLSRDVIERIYITMEYIDRPVKYVLDSNIFECVYCRAWLNKLEKLLSIFASVASMSGYRETQRMSRVSVLSAKVLIGTSQGDVKKLLNHSLC